MSAVRGRVTCHDCRVRITTQIKITCEGDGRFSAKIVPTPWSEADYWSSGAMDWRELVAALSARGQHSTDITDAFDAAGVQWPPGDAALPFRGASCSLVGHPARVSESDRGRALVMNLGGVLDAIRTRPDVAGIRIVGVDGPSGSGKSTLAKQLAARAEAPLVQADDFVSWSDFGGWWARFEAQVLQRLLAHQAAEYQVRDWTGDEFGQSLDGWKITPWAPLVVIEGVTCTRRATIGQLTYTIWVEAPADVRLRRGLARDGESRRALWERWMEDEDRFFADDGTRGRADVRVDGTADRMADSEQLILID